MYYIQCSRFNLILLFIVLQRRWMALIDLCFPPCYCNCSFRKDGRIPKSLFILVVLFSLTLLSFSSNCLGRRYTPSTSKLSTPLTWLRQTMRAIHLANRDRVRAVHSKMTVNIPPRRTPHKGSRVLDWPPSWKRLEFNVRGKTFPRHSYKFELVHEEKETVHAAICSVVSCTPLYTSQIFAYQGILQHALAFSL